MNNFRQSNHLKYVWLIMSVFLFASVHAQSKKPVKRTAKSKEQTSFSSEGKVSKPVKIPRSILKQLAAYDDGQLGKCQADKSRREPNVADHFAASALNLNDDKQTDFLVQARTSCFKGAHNTSFWIFSEKKSETAPSYDLAFDIAVDFLKILKNSTGGFRDIETSSHTATELYTIAWKFDGQKYQKIECRVTDENDKVRKVDCNP